MASILQSSDATKGNTTWLKSHNPKGEFVRKPSTFRDFVTADGSSGFKASQGRYHLYVSYACPWAHRSLIVHSLKGLEDVIGYTVVDWFLDEKGWTFTDQKPGCGLDTVNNCQTLREVYKMASPGYDGRVTVPVLWDKEKKTIVNNESSEIIRMLNSAFNDFCSTEQQKKLDLYPKASQEQIDAINDWIYPMINNGVYRSGFAQSQEAYNGAVNELFEGLEKVEDILSKNRYLVGDKFTEADVRLFTTLVRFDAVYHGHFKCNRKRIVDYPNMWPYVREIYQMPGVSETVNMEHITKHYMMSHKSINPFGIVSIGPELDFNESHGRDKIMPQEKMLLNQVTSFHNKVTADGSSGFKAESDRYHLYVSLACPFAHRTLALRALKGLQSVISCTVVDPILVPDGWAFTDKKPHCSLDSVNNCKMLRDVYNLAEPEFQGKVSVPVFWDKEKKTIVNNESSEIMHFLNSEFNAFCPTEEQRQLNLYPAGNQSKIDEANEWVTNDIALGVYKVGFSKTQELYEEAIVSLFEALNKAEGILSESRYLIGSQLTTVDIKLFVALLRFDYSYHDIFKCNKRYIHKDYPNLWAFVRDIYQMAPITDTVDFGHIRSSYALSTPMRQLFPDGVISIGPDLDFTAAHGRDENFTAAHNGDK